MQGGIWPGTLETAKMYAENYCVIISTMEGESIESDHDNIKIIKSPMPENRGQGNMNLQIVSSLAGVRAASCVPLEITIKTRTDQRISIETLAKMIDIFHNDPMCRICVLGNQSKFPFSSQDHLYIGYKEHLITLFDIPLNREPLTGTWGKKEWGAHQQADKGLDFNVHLRMPIYLGAMYYAKFYPEVKHYIENWREYLTDNAPKRAEAMAFYDKVKNSLFRVLPKFPDAIWWEKMNCYYPYEMYEPQGEYYAPE